MGMGAKEIEDKFEDVFEFAELERFRNMKLKNFSSGCKPVLPLRPRVFLG